MLEINKTEIELKLYGNIYKVIPPKALQVAKFKKKIDEKPDEVTMITLAVDFLVECGLPQDACEQLEMEHLQQVIELVSSKKK